MKGTSAMSGEKRRRDERGAFKRIFSCLSAWPALLGSCSGFRPGNTESMA